METENIYEIFENYLDNKLQFDERAAFETSLETNENLKEQFEIYTQTQQFLALENVKETAQFKANLKQIATANNNVNKPKTIALNPKWFAVAAAITLLFGTWFFTQNNNVDYNQYNQHETVSFTSRGQNNEVLQQAETLFNTQKYTEAVQKFETIKHASVEINLTYAICLIETNNFSKAETILQNITKTQNVFKNKASWYLALSALKQNNKTKTIEILKTLPTDAEEFEKAQEIIENLE